MDNNLCNVLLQLHIQNMIGDNNFFTTNRLNRCLTNLINISIHLKIL